MSVRAERYGAKRIKVTFSEATPRRVRAVKAIPGRNRVSDGWSLPLTPEVCRDLRRAYGDELKVGPNLAAWARHAFRQADLLADLSQGLDAQLHNVAALAAMSKLRPYQRGGAAFVAQAPAILLADKPGLGKTAQLIAGIYEAGLEDDCHLVVAPKSALVSTWARELDRWQDRPWWVLSGDLTPKQRARVVEDYVAEAVETGWGGWLVTSSSMVTYVAVFDTAGCEEHDDESPANDKRWCAKNHCGCIERDQPAFPAIHAIDWSTVTFDECDRAGLRNPRTLTSLGMRKLSVVHKRIAMTGSPIHNNDKDLWGILHWLDPERFSGYWAWAQRWFETESETIVVRGGRLRETTSVGRVREDRKQDFYRELAPYILRRTKEEVAKDLPAKDYDDRWATMTKTQAAQYEEMALDAETRLTDGSILSSVGALATYTNLKRFANAACRRDDDGRVVFTGDSGKFDTLEEVLAERGVRKKSPFGQDKVVVFSQWTRMVKATIDHLSAAGIESMSLTGEYKARHRAEVVDRWQSPGGPRVLVMSTRAGGSSLTLDAHCDTVVFLDEEWEPTAQEQAEDRVHRISRIHQVTVVYIRSLGTIDQSIMDLNVNKVLEAWETLDGRRGVPIPTRPAALLTGRSHSRT